MYITQNVLKGSDHLIKEKRQQLGWSQAKLASKIGTTPNAISNYECGTRIPKWDIALKISKVLNIPLEEIVNKSCDN